MKINIRGKNVDVTPALEERVHKKLSKMNKFFDDNAEIQVVLSVTREEHVIEVTVNYNSLIFRCEEATGDMYASIDQVVDKLEKQAKKYKTKTSRRHRKPGIRKINEQMSTLQADEEDSDEPRIVRTKQFILKPMSVEEAVMQMDMLSHNFFVFNNSDTDTFSVVYRRKDGNFGLIEPGY